MKLPLTITRTGLSALVDAQAGEINAVRIASMGLTASPFIAAPTLTSLPGEHTRLETVGGNAVSENVLHVVASDSTDSTYTVTGIGLFTDGGDLFGIFSLESGEDALFEKAAAATFLFAADITFEGGEAALIDFGEANFLNPPASATVKGVAKLATDSDWEDGGNQEKIVTPAQALGHFIPVWAAGAANGVATLDGDGKVPPSQLPAVDSIDTFEVNNEAEMLALPAGPGDFARRLDVSKTYVLAAAPATTLANWREFLSPGAPVRSVNGKIGDVVLAPADLGAVPAARKVDTAGLVRGGGDLSANRIISVTEATVEEVLAGVAWDKAVTPAGLSGVLNDLFGRVPAGRRVDATGLAVGGGDLSANRSINVPAATSADVEGMTNATRALTAAALAGTLRSMSHNGYLRIPGTPLILQWGEQTYPAGAYSKRNFYFPITFPNACWHVFTTHYGDPNDGDDGDEEMVVSWRAKEYFTYQTNAEDHAIFNFGYLAIGV